MKMNRRQFVILSAGLLASCATTKTGINGATSAPGERVIDAGPVEVFREDGVYDLFRHQGFFLIRRGRQLLALSSTCTHRSCTLSVESDRSFSCPCHGSTFNPEGVVIKGPAQGNLNLLSVATDAQGRVQVRLPIA